jgi:UDP-N-acetylglucosamine diphosphorylase / glucose-1-phosphate thymidylyltransferase / UDP-N-acetylgalactosamine diphosphorylase / glucosamine-1-phosphate N-acetyltransferase / galactosamine-1-phosphate N-acetyltransferase
MMNVIMPMAGRGSRFEGSGYQRPKPLIEVQDKPMFAWALESLQDVSYNQLIIISLQEHEAYFGVRDLVRKYAPANTELILLPAITEGQLATVLAAREFIKSPEDLLIISSDTIVKSPIGKDILNKPPDCEGIISVADMPGDRWSFARTDRQGKVVEVSEKVRISPHASTGLYYFSSGRKFIQLTDSLILSQKKTRGEYYVMPLYGEYLQAGSHIAISQATEMWDLGTPESLREFLAP